MCFHHTYNNGKSNFHFGAGSGTLSRKGLCKLYSIGSVPLIKLKDEDMFEIDIQLTCVPRSPLLNLIVDSTYTVGKLKKMISDETGIKPMMQKLLIFGKFEMRDLSPLARYRIHAGSKLQLKLQKFRIRIYVVIWSVISWSDVNNWSVANRSRSRILESFNFFEDVLRNITISELKSIIKQKTSTMIDGSWDKQISFWPIYDISDSIKDMVNTSSMRFYQEQGYPDLTEDQNLGYRLKEGSRLQQNLCYYRMMHTR